MDQRNYISVHDFSNVELDSLFDVADSMRENVGDCRQIPSGALLGSLFFEPSTRTRLSFEAAMNRLGGRVISVTGAGTSSAAKGESLADSIRIVSSYVDVIVLRHPRSGAALVAAESSSVPVINAGDGGHEHPTQTLCDLYALRQSRGRLDGLKVLLYGDLKYGRTTHSLALALTRLGSDVLCVAEPTLGLPDYVRMGCAVNTGVEAIELEMTGAESTFGSSPAATLLTHDPEGWRIDNNRVDVSSTDFDAIYVTRLQTERLEGEGEAVQYSLPNIDATFLKASMFSSAVILHPLPRLEEISPEVDQDPRAMYFQQAAWGVPVRMALLAVLLGKEVSSGATGPSVLEELEGAPACRYSNCISVAESHALPARAVMGVDGQRRCRYCDHEL